MLHGLGYGSRVLVSDLSIIKIIKFGNSAKKFFFFLDMVLWIQVMLFKVNSMWDLVKECRTFSVNFDYRRWLVGCDDLSMTDSVKEVPKLLVQIQNTIKFVGYNINCWWLEVSDRHVKDPTWIHTHTHVITLNWRVHVSQQLFGVNINTMI